MPLPPAIHRLSPIEESRIRTNKNYPQIATIPESKVDKIRLTNEQIKEFNLVYYKLQKGSITIDKAVLEIRAGGFSDWSALAFIIFMYSVHQSDSFQSVPLPHMDPLGWLSGKYDSRNAGSSPSRPTTRLKMEKPVLMPQHEYSALTKSERRQLPDPRGRDRFIDVDGSPRLDLRFNQVGFQTPKHGKDHDLPVSNNDKTPKTEANVIALRDSLLDMPNRENIVWYTDGQYQGGTERGCDCVNIFDPDTNVIAAYQKQPDGSNLFLTTCTLTERERDHLKTTNGNFVTEKVLEQKNSVSTFEIDAPISPMDEN